jgi:GNAT superfamily N-acetyltransferase
MPIIELKTSKDFVPAYKLVIQTNSTLSKSDFNKRLKKMLAQGYRCIAMEKNGEYLGICGFWWGTRFWCGDFIDLDNVVVDEKHRGKNIGKELVAWVENLAKQTGCTQTGLDCYVTFNEAHRFYFREGYIIKGYHFIKPLKKTEKKK